MPIWGTTACLLIPTLGPVPSRRGVNLAPSSKRNLYRRSALKSGLSPEYPIHDTPADPGDDPVLKGVILGGGSFGLAMAHVLCRKGVVVTLLMRNKLDAEAINVDRRHPRYLSDLEVPTAAHATTDEKEALRDASFVVHCVPVQHSRRYLRKIAKLVPNGLPVLCTSKGIDRKTLSLMCEILPSQLGEGRSYAFLSGPSFAREIAEGLATAVVVASEDGRIAFDFRDLLASESFRVFTSADVVGLEVGGGCQKCSCTCCGHV